MNSFSFVRHNFLRAGCEVIDCPPLTNQQKNAADIRMVMDLRDYLTHPTYFDEFVILSADADFTPVLHRLRQHARRTVIYTNDHMAAAYTAICDGEVREGDLISLLLEGQTLAAEPRAPAALAGRGGACAAAPESGPSAAQLRIEDLAPDDHEPRSSPACAPRPARCRSRHSPTAPSAPSGTSAPSARPGPAPARFRELLRIGLPTDLRLTEQAPFYAYRSDAPRAVAQARRPRSRVRPSPAASRRRRCSRPSPSSSAWRRRRHSGRRDSSPRQPAPAAAGPAARCASSRRRRRRSRRGLSPPSPSCIARRHRRSRRARPLRGWTRRQRSRP